MRGRRSMREHSEAGERHVPDPLEYETPQPPPRRAGKGMTALMGALGLAVIALGGLYIREWIRELPLRPRGDESDLPATVLPCGLVACTIGAMLVVASVFIWRRL